MGAAAGDRSGTDLCTVSVDKVVEKLREMAPGAYPSRLCDELVTI
jgi:hypothetical protein